jgi:transglutaminase-like putative cysteine protease
MRLRIEHVTIYTYARPVTFHRHRLVIRPREGHDLRVERMHLQLEPAHHVQWIRDVFGNSIALVDWLEPAKTLRIVNDVIVERTAPFPARTLHQPWVVPFPPQYDPLETAVVAAYSQPDYADDVPALRAWLREMPSMKPHDAEGTILEICRHVFSTVKYRRRMEKGVQTPAETLREASGSCRDMATLLMEAARVQGVAARFASGYLHGRASLAGNASTHAWAEVYLPTLGWRGFDPTIGGITSTQHIVTGVCTHPRGVMPVSGTFTGARADYLGSTANVKSTLLDEVESAS